MSVLEPTPPLARPVSLLLPPERPALQPSPVLDATSYSPFPTIAGSGHSRDPFGLNAFLLHPGDSLWDYMQPQPAAAPASPTAVQPGLDAYDGDMARGRPAGPARHASLAHRASSVLRKPSPLAAPPLALGDEADMPAPQIEEPGRVKPRSVGRKSLRRVLHTSRKSTDGFPVPPVPGAEAMAAAGATAASAPTTPDDPTTPMSTRSRSTCSAVSSVESDDGLRTPADDVDARVALNLADALSDVEAKRAKTWRSWFGARRASTVNLVPSSSLSGDTTPASSAAASPSASMTDLAGARLQPAASIVASTPRRDPSLPPLALRQRTAMQLRQLSLAKLESLRYLSPHPLARLIKQGHAQLPDEVASGLHESASVFPRSVNAHRRPASPAVPRLRLMLGARAVVAKVDDGAYPDQLLRPRPPHRASTLPRPRGVRDFVERPTFEERNIVFFPNDAYSPISMARPGNAVWDLDFSPYLLALAQCEEPTRDRQGWAGPLPRASIGAVIDGFDVDVLAAAVGDDVEMLASPVEDSGAALRSLTASANVAPVAHEIRVVPPSPDEAPAAAVAPAAPGPASSFRRASRITTWDSSDSEEEDEEAPLSSMARARPAMLRVRSETALAARVRPRTASQPQRQSRFLDPDSALDTVSRARERRLANASGQGERQAEAEARRAQHRASGAASLAPPRLAKQKSTPNLAAVPEAATRSSTVAPSRSTPSTPQKQRPASGAVAAIGTPQWPRHALGASARSSSFGNIQQPKMTPTKSSTRGPSASHAPSQAQASPSRRRTRSAYGELPSAVSSAPPPLPRAATFYEMPRGAASHGALPVWAPGPAVHMRPAMPHAYSHPAMPLYAMPTRTSLVVPASYTLGYNVAPPAPRHERRIA